MNDVLIYLNENPAIIFFIFIAVFIFVFSTLYVRGKKAEEIFNGLDLSKIQFREKGASGFSSRSLATKFGGASRALDIIVTNNELCIKGIYPPFTYIGTRVDLTHRIKTRDITEIEEKGPKVELSFSKPDGDHKVTLHIKEMAKFIQAIKG